VYTVVRGHIVMDHGTVLSEPGFGRFVPGAGVSQPKREEQLARGRRSLLE
jgi:hypothetical protein